MFASQDLFLALFLATPLRSRGGLAVAYLSLPAPLPIIFRLASGKGGSGDLRTVVVTRVPTGGRPTGPRSGAPLSRDGVQMLSAFLGGSCHLGRGEAEGAETFYMRFMFQDKCSEIRLLGTRKSCQSHCQHPSSNLPRLPSTCSTSSPASPGWNE